MRAAAAHLCGLSCSGAVNSSRPTPRSLSQCVPATLANRSATTHTDLLLRAQNRGIPTQTIHNASIMTALGSSGLQMYNFGQAISLPFYTATWTPDSWYDRLEENLRYGMHTLVLLDIKVREQSEENMAR